MHLAEVIFDIEFNFILACVHEVFKGRGHGDLFEFFQKSGSSAHFASKFVEFLLVNIFVVKNTTRCVVDRSLFNDGLTIGIKLGPPIVTIDSILEGGILEEKKVEEFVPCKTVLFGASRVLDLIVQLTFALDLQSAHKFGVLRQLRNQILFDNKGLAP